MDMQIVGGLSHGCCRCTYLQTYVDVYENVSVGWCFSGRVIAWALSRNERENSGCRLALTLAIALTWLCV